MYFALAHNGVLYNDRNLKDSENLPKTCIETDSYVAAKAIARCFLKKHTFEGVPIEEGEIIRIDSNGELERGCFMVDEKYYGYTYGLGRRISYWDDYCDYLDEMGQGDLFEVCSSFGLSQDDLLLLYEMGYDDEEIETMLYDTDLLKQCVEEAQVCINEYY